MSISLINTQVQPFKAQAFHNGTEMDHAYWLEQQLRLIELVGLANYQQSQMPNYLQSHMGSAGD